MVLIIHRPNSSVYRSFISNYRHPFLRKFQILFLPQDYFVAKTQHTGLSPASSVSTLKKVNGVFGGDDITIGAGKDVLGNDITSDKAWETGQYNLVILYHNMTFNVSTFKSIPVTISY